MIAAGDCQAETQTSKAAPIERAAAKAAAGSLRAGCLSTAMSAAPFDALPLLPTLRLALWASASGGSIPNRRDRALAALKRAGVSGLFDGLGNCPTTKVGASPTTHLARTPWIRNCKLVSRRSPAASG